MNQPELCTWLRNNSSGIYRPAAEAASVIEAQAREIEHWRFVAAYLASCHAATLIGLPKAAPKSHRSRFAKICSECVSLLRGKTAPQTLGGMTRTDSIEAAITRCAKAVAEHGPEDSKPVHNPSS